MDSSSMQQNQSMADNDAADEVPKLGQLYFLTSTILTAQTCRCHSFACS